MSFQDFINNKASEKTALEAALARVIAELQAANSAAPAVDSVVSKIQELMIILQASPSAVVSAAKEAIRESCGDISLLVAQPREVSTLVVPQFIVEESTVSPVLADLVGETATNSSVTLEVTNTTPANEILPFDSSPKADADSSSTEETNKPKRRTQAGFARKVDEWGKALDTITVENYETVIATLDDEYKFWANGSKFSDAEIEERLRGAIAHWTSQETTDDESEETTEDYVPVIEPVKVAEVLEVLNTEDLSSFDVESENELSEEIEYNVTLTNTLNIETGEVTTAVDIVETPVQHYTQSFLDKLNADNLSESGLGDLQEEIRVFYGTGNIPQELADAICDAWAKLDTESEGDQDDLTTGDIEDLVDFVEEIADNYSDDQDSESAQIEETLATKEGIIIESTVSDSSVYEGDVPEEEELDSQEGLEATRRAQILENNAKWQNSILTNCETLEELADWDKFIAKAIDKDNESVTPETLEALDNVRERLEAREAEKSKTVDKDALITDWLNRAELAFDLEEIQAIYDEIRESTIVPSMLLVKTLDNAKARLTQVEKPIEPTPEPAISEEEQIARESISNQWQPIAVESSVIEEITAHDQTTLEPTTTTNKKNPFAGRKTKVQTVVAEEATATSNASDYVSISKINTSGIFNFKTLDGATEPHHRFDERYIQEPGIKLYEPSTGFIFEVVTWEEAKSLSPLTTEDVNKLPIKSLHSPARSYAKTADKTEVFVIVSDQQANDLVAKYRARLSQMDTAAAIPMTICS